MALYDSHIKRHEHSGICHSELLNFVRHRIWNSKSYKFWQINKTLEHVPTMLTDEEKRLLNWLAQYYVTGRGQIVELGAFLGGSTIQLGSGLSKNKQLKSDNVKIHSYDRFELSEMHKKKWLYDNGFDNFEGTDVLHMVTDFLKDYKQDIVFHQEDFRFSKWNDQKIELLFIDIAKTWELSDVIVKQFFPNLIPGHSIVIQQDMLFMDCPWICAVMYRLKDYFELLCAALTHSVMFLNTKKITPEIADEALSFKFSPDEVIMSIDYFIGQMSYYPHIEILTDCKHRFEKNKAATKAWELH